MNLFNNEKTLDIKFPNEDGYSCKYDEENKVFRIKIPNGELIYAPQFFEKKVSDRSMDYFLENNLSYDWEQIDWREYEKEKLQDVKFVNIEWSHDQIKMFGKLLYIPRYSAWYGDSDKPYTYSGLTLQPKPWNKGLNYIKQQINELADVKFNSVLLNWYRDGEDSIGWHTDAEKELGKNPVIGSVNFGQTRRFIIRRINDKKIKIEFPLGHGSLLIMKGELQHFWQHSVPKETKVKGNRINLTFRVIY